MVAPDRSGQGAWALKSYGLQCRTPILPYTHLSRSGTGPPGGQAADQRVEILRGPARRPEFRALGFAILKSQAWARANS